MGLCGNLSKGRNYPHCSRVVLRVSIKFPALFEGYQPRRLQTAIRVIHFPLSSLLQQIKPIMTTIPPFHWTQSLRCTFISRFRTLFRLFHSPTTATRACLTRRCFFLFLPVSNSNSIDSREIHSAIVTSFGSTFCAARF